MPDCTPNPADLMSSDPPDSRARAPVAFVRAGRGVQPAIADGHALVGVLDLDRALWVATGAPVASIRADPGFLAYLDVDGDGRVRADELCAALRWTLASLVDPGDIRTGNTSTRVDRLAPAAVELRAAARLVLAEVGLGESDELTLDVVRRQARVGAGALGCLDPELRALVDSLESRFDQYFTLCRAARLDPTVVERALPVAEPLDLLDPVALAAWIARAPLAPPRPDGLLVLRAGINPADEARVDRLRREVLRPMLGTQADTLDERAWVHASVPEGHLADSRYVVSGSALQLTHMRVVQANPTRGGKDGSTGWWAAFSLVDGRVTPGKPVFLDANVSVRMRDTVPLVTVFAQREALPGWVRGMLALEGVAGEGRVLFGETTLRLPALSVRAAGLEVRLRLVRSRALYYGSLFAQYGSLRAGLAVDGVESRLVLARPLDWYDAQGSPRAP